jgi:hypothetical protein
MLVLALSVSCADFQVVYLEAELLELFFVTHPFNQVIRDAANPILLLSGATVLWSINVERSGRAISWPTIRGLTQSPTNLCLPPVLHAIPVRSKVGNEVTHRPIHRAVNG